MPQAIPLILMAVSTAVTVYASVQAGNAQKRAAQFNEKVAQNNAIAAQQQGAAAAEEKHREMVQRIGSIEAGYGAAGVTSDSGSALDVLSSSVQQGTLDQLTEKYNYALKGQGYQNSATLDDFQGQNAQFQGDLNATSSLLNGASSMYGQAHPGNSVAG